MSNFQLWILIGVVAILIIVLVQRWGREMIDKASTLGLRGELVRVALEWQRRFGVAPHITAAISEYDAAMLLGMPEEDYSYYMQDKTAVSKGADFVFKEKSYQIKANRPSGKPGSKVTLVAKAKNYEWDYLIWIHYNKEYEIQEAWLWEVSDYREKFDEKTRLSPDDYREGNRLR